MGRSSSANLTACPFKCRPSWGLRRSTWRIVAIIDLLVRKREGHWIDRLRRRTEVVVRKSPPIGIRSLLKRVSIKAPPRRLPGRSLRPLEVIHASNVLDDAVASRVPDVHAEGEVRLGLYGQARPDSPWPAGIYTRMLLRSVTLPERLHRTLPPQPSTKAPAGAGWIHEIKLDGFRLLARRDAAGVRLLTRRRHTMALSPRGGVASMKSGVAPWDSR
jgi:hypothetical protein